MAEGSGQCLCSYGSRNDACWQESTEYTCRHRLQSSERAPARQKRPACRATASKLLSPAGFKLRSTSVATAMCQLALCIVTLPVLVQVVLDALQSQAPDKATFILEENSVAMCHWAEGRRATVKEETAIGMNQESNRLSALIN